MMRIFAQRVVGCAVGTFILGAAASGCTSSYGRLGTTSRLVITFDAKSDGSPQNVGTKASPLPLTFDSSTPILIDVTAYDANGQIDPTYNGYVRISVKPGAVVDLSGNGVDGRNVLLQHGVATNLAVSVAGSYGATHFWAEDIGYTPADPRGTPPPECSDGIDNNQNGLIDFPADPGCAYANDDNEDLGTYATGASDTIWFVTPRVADVRGVSQGGAATSFPNQQVEVDTGFHPTPDNPRNYDFSVVVTRISSDGFFVTDINDKRADTSVFAYNFSTPPLMRICDRLNSFGGTSSDFFGFTEINYPTWELEEWDPRLRPCLVPEPYDFVRWVPTLQGPNEGGVVNEVTRTFPSGDLVSPQLLTTHIAALVRVASDPAHKIDVHVTQHFGPNFPDKPGYVPTNDATNCDLNNDGKVDFTTDPEMTCNNNCTNDPECTEYSGFEQRSEFNLVVQNPDPSGVGNDVGQILADGSSSATFDPVAMRGQPIRAFTGTLRYFSGGTQYTIEARCDDDIVTDMNGTPLDSDRACVHPRTSSDNDTASN